VAEAGAAGGSALPIGVLLSGSGRTLQNLIDRIRSRELDARVAVVVSDRADAYGLERARAAGCPAFLERDPARQHELLVAHGVRLVCLCGYLRLFPIRPPFEGAVLNIHPALLPRHGGKGMYGDRVHAAVLAAREPESGCTVHLCDEQYDHGGILVQMRVPVLPGDDAHALADRVFLAECEAYPAAIRLWARTRAPLHRPG
jgi:formyltetrahydrofolate-dependent phosphoribosylglycinamide formyltransferase